MVAVAICRSLNFKYMDQEGNDVTDATELAKAQRQRTAIRSAATARSRGWGLGAAPMLNYRAADGVPTSLLPPIAEGPSLIINHLSLLSPPLPPPFDLYPTSNLDHTVDNNNDDDEYYDFHDEYEYDSDYENATIRRVLASPATGRRLRTRGCLWAHRESSPSADPSCGRCTRSGDSALIVPVFVLKFLLVSISAASKHLN
ncbi:hypothetical protein DFS34DRAFT_597688 [Phlyctochytrium arcticum]|nr:hypothetical protein DFS34DRAFT_597688 [Phlyctochytrium arcticum]